MATVEEILRQAGYTNEQVRSLDPRTITAFSGVLTAAQEAREAAELAQRSNVEFYENKIQPSLVEWDAEKTRIDNDRANERAELAYYKAQNEAARQSGFIAADAPGFQPRDNQGRYVAGVPGATPGSPTFDMNTLYERAGDAVGILTDIQWEHQRLFGQPMPISPTELVKRADQVRLDPRTYASREFKFDERRQQMQAEESKKHDDEIRRERDKYWAERTGSNPDIRAGVDSKYADMRRAQQAGRMPDPLLMGESERRQATRQAIRQDMAEETR
jgi:hypothetical protein